MKKNIFKIFLIALILATAFLFELLLNPVTKGNKYYILQKWEEAERAYLTAQRYRPDSYIINYNLGNIYFKKGDYDKAISYFQKAVEGEKGFLRVIIISALPMLKRGFSMRPSITMKRRGA